MVEYIKSNWIFVLFVSLLLIIFFILFYVVKKTKDNEILNKNYTEASISLLIGIFVTFSINALNIQNELQNKFVCKQSEQIINSSISLGLIMLTFVMIVVAIIRKSEDERKEKENKESRYIIDIRVNRQIQRKNKGRKKYR